jgi:hypothetical protein
LHRLKHWLPLLVVVLVAIAFRLPMLDTLPPGLNFDEGGEGVAALDVAQGNFRVMWPIGGGKEPLMAYLVQPLFWIFGPTRLALRLYSALWGVGAVLATYFFTRQLMLAAYQPGNEDSSAAIYVEWVPVFAALGLATAFWHVAYSRIAFRALSNPAVVALALGFLWRGLRSGRWPDYFLAGLFTGGLAYTYLAGRFVPLGIALFFLAEAAMAWYRKRQPLLVQHWRKLGGLAGLAGLVFLPLGLFFLQNPGTFGQRATAVSIFNPQMTGGDFWGTLWQTGLTTLGTFLSLSGDPNELGNIPGRPQLSLLLAIFFVLGVGKAIYHCRKSPYLFLLIWWPVMLLPGILAPEDAPHHLRLIGSAPGTYTFVGLGIGWLLAVGSRRPAISRYGLGWLVLLALFGLTAFQTYRDYFVRWANEVEHYMAFDIYAEELAHQMAAETDPALAYAIPMDLRAAHEARHYSLDFLYQGQTPFSYLVVDETTVADALTGAAQGKAWLRLVRWTQDKHQAADEKELVTFLLATGGATPVEQNTYPAYTVETYDLSGVEKAFDFPEIDRPVDVTLDGLIQIRRAVVLPQVTPANQVAVGMTLARIAPAEVDYKASLRLVGPDGTQVSQVDRTLRHNWRQGTSLWPPEEVNEYYLLPLPQDAADGVYEVRAVIYHPQTLAPLTENGLVEVSLGQIHISAPDMV